MLENKKCVNASFGNEYMTQNVLVSICCVAYNHAPYIRQCLDGFLMQKTNFLFEILIHDDASTDETARIIRQYEAKYPQIKPVYQIENQYSKGVNVGMVYNYSRTKGKYIAICEGDDYWIDPLKLQKQVDFMQAHQEYGIVHTSFDFVDVNSCTIPPPNKFYEKMSQRIFNGYIYDYYLIYPGFILTASVLFRKDSYLRYGEENNFKYSYDHFVFMQIASNSLCYYLNEKTTAYRRNPNGMMMTKSQKLKEMHTYTIFFQLSKYVQKPAEIMLPKGAKSRVHRRASLAFYSLLVRFYLLKDYKALKETFKLLLQKPSFLIEFPIAVPFLIYRHCK